VALLSHIVVATEQTSNEKFWEGFDPEEEPFEHEWRDIPDLIGKELVTWYFHMSHHLLTGVFRGIYANDTIRLHKDCFGPKYVTKLNELKAMIDSDWQ
jgi:hypothetical protein